MSEAAKIPNPGSDEAISQGCMCPILDNCRGMGIGLNGAKHGWWIDSHCPLHAARSKSLEYGSDEEFTGDGAPKAFTE